MVLRMYTVFDQKAKAWLPPFFLPQEGVAIRTFGDCVNSPDHNFGRHPEDYSLFCIGSFDDAVGVVTAAREPVLVVQALQLKTQRPALSQLDMLDKERVA